MMKPFSLLFLLVALSACEFKYDPVDVANIDAEQPFKDFDGITVKVGDPIPPFELVDGRGNSFNSETLKNNKGTLLLFYRGDWCPYCVSQLDDWQNLLPQLKTYGIQLVAISPDDAATTQNTSRRFGQNYIFLSDKELELTKAMGIASQKDLPHPSVFLLNQNNRVLWFYASSDYKTRPTVKQILDILDSFFKSQG